MAQDKQNTTEELTKESDGTFTRKITISQLQYDIQKDIDNLKLENTNLQNQINENTARISLLEGVKSKSK